MDQPAKLDLPGPAENGREWILYDSDCSMCLGFVRRFEKILDPQKFSFAPLQTPWVIERLKLPTAELLREMRVITRRGEIIGGADAVVYLYQFPWWGKPLHFLGKLPGIKQILRIGYRWVAKRRQCLGGTCRLPKKPS